MQFFRFSYHVFFEVPREEGLGRVFAGYNVWRFSMYVAVGLKFAKKVALTDWAEEYSFCVASVV